MRRISGFAVPVALAFTLAACGGSGSKDESSACLDVSDTTQAWIASGILPETGATARGWQAVKSDDFENVYMVAADLEGPSLDGNDQVAVWAINTVTEDHGLTLSVDGMAKEFSNWLHGDTSDANVTLSSDGYDEAKSCVTKELDT